MAANGSTSPGSDEEKRRAVLYLDPLERKVGLIGAAVAVLLAVTARISYVYNPKTPGRIGAGKGHSCPAPYHFVKAANDCQHVFPRSHWVESLALMLAFAVAIFVAVRIGRRAPLGFAALMTGLAFESQAGVQILALPFIFGGGWLLIRSWRVQRFGSPTATRTNPTGERRAPPSRAERPARAKKTKTPQWTGPTPSKRYTPKTPKRPRPTPTQPAS